MKILRSTNLQEKYYHVIFSNRKNNKSDADKATLKQVTNTIHIILRIVKEITTWEVNIALTQILVKSSHFLYLPGYPGEISFFRQFSCF